MYDCVDFFLKIIVTFVEKKKKTIATYLDICNIRDKRF